MSLPQPTEDRFCGCLIGQCVGDAIGFIVEGQPSQVCRSHLDAVLRDGRSIEGHRGPFPLGQYSDDSQLARELLSSYVACGRFEPEDYARRIAAIFVEERIVGRGRATEDAALRLAAGVPWQEAGTPPPNAGNGSAMRAGPIGLMFHDDIDGLIRAACDQGRITHADSRCSGGAVAIAGAVALALRDEPLEPKVVLDRLAEWAGAVDSTMADALRRLSDWLTLSPEKAVTFISRAGLPTGSRDMWIGISPFVVGSVLWSLYAFLRTPDDYAAAIDTAIAVGGDVDTTAAMTGAIAGARNGLNAPPSHVATRLNDQGNWTYDDLVGLAQQAWRVKAATKRRPV